MRRTGEGAVLGQGAGEESSKRGEQLVQFKNH